MIDTLGQGMDAGALVGVAEDVERARDPRRPTTVPLLDQHADLMADWMAVLPGLVEALPLLGIEERDIMLTGHPLLVSIGSWATVQPCISSGTSVAVVRASSPSQAAVVVGINGTPGAVVADLLDAVEVLLLRRNRRLDQDRAAKEAEMREMVEATGWVSSGVGGAEITAGFRDGDDRIRGRVVRSEHRREDPASDRFAISLEVSTMTYAAALEALAALRRGLVPAQPRRREGPTAPAPVPMPTTS